MTVLAYALAALVLVPFLSALALVIACRVHDRRRDRREATERLLLLTGTETAPDPHPYAAGRDRLAADLDPDDRECR